MRKIRNYKEFCVTIIFLLIMIFGLLNSITCRFGLGDLSPKVILTDGISPTIRNVEKRYNKAFSSAELSRDLFSIIQHMLGKHEVRNFEVIRSKDDVLYFQSNPWPVDEEILDQIADQIEKCKDETNCYGGEFLFVQVPYKNPDNVRELKYYTDDRTELAEDRLTEMLSEKNINVLDLRDNEKCVQMYRTDHHWTIDAAFNSAYVISEYIMNQFDKEIGGIHQYGNIDNYEVIKYEESFLGSLGIKVGRYYVGKDDFLLYRPKFKTDIELSHYVDDELVLKKRGEFLDSLIDKSVLDNVKFNNKNHSLLYDSDHEVVINNNLAENDTSVLIVTHSYGRPLAMYMSLYYKNLRYLDPQQGRYSGNILDYINQNKPDVVIVAYNDCLNIGQ